MSVLFLSIFLDWGNKILYFKKICHNFLYFYILKAIILANFFEKKHQSAKNCMAFIKK